MSKPRYKTVAAMLKLTANDNIGAVRAGDPGNLADMVVEEVCNVLSDEETYPDRASQIRGVIEGLESWQETLGYVITALETHET